MSHVFALTDGVSTAPDGAVVTTARGQVWEADDSFVLARPDLFSVDPPLVHNTTGSAVRDVEPLSAGKPASRKAAKK